MNQKTAWKYRRLDRLPSELRAPHTWRTREDPFGEVWAGVREKLEVNPGSKRRRFSMISTAAVRVGSRRGSYARFSEGLQSALWELGGVPRVHRTDRLSTAIKQTWDPDEFTKRYRA